MNSYGGDDCEQAFLAPKETGVATCAGISNLGRNFVLSMDTSDMRMGTELEQEQEEDRRIVKCRIVYVSKTLNASQRQC